MENVLSGLTAYMMIGIVLVIGVSQFNRMIGGILGVLFWIAVAVIGTSAYEQGGSIGLPGYRFSRELFYGVCFVFGTFSALTAYRAYVKKTRFVKPRSSEDESS